MKGFSKIMALEKTTKYLKIEKSVLYKIAREGKIPAVKIEIGKNDKIIIHILHNQELMRYNQELLGYKSSKATEIYNHVNRRNLSVIKDSLDNLLKGGKNMSKRMKTKFIRRKVYVNSSHVPFIWKYVRTVRI